MTAGFKGNTEKKLSKGGRKRKVSGRSSKTETMEEKFCEVAH